MRRRATCVRRAGRARVRDAASERAQSVHRQRERRATDGAREIGLDRRASPLRQGVEEHAVRGHAVLRGRHALAAFRVEARERRFVERQRHEQRAIVLGVHRSEVRRACSEGRASASA
jgi:hypothetical protein